MSSSQLPSLPGLEWNIKTAPQFMTNVKTAVSGSEIRTSLRAYPLWVFTLSWEFLRNGNRGADFQTLLGFFLSLRGQGDSFLFQAPWDYTVTDHVFATGDGITRQFQLVRVLGSGGFTFAEPVQNVNTLTNIKVAGVTQTLNADYTIDSSGFVTFTTAPVNAASITWTGTYFYRCRLMIDEAEFNQFMSDLWDLKKFTFKGAPGNKV